MVRNSCYLTTIHHGPKASRTLCLRDVRPLNMTYNSERTDFRKSSDVHCRKYRGHIPGVGRGDSFKHSSHSCRFDWDLLRMSADFEETSQSEGLLPVTGEVTLVHPPLCTKSPSSYGDPGHRVKGGTVRPRVSSTRVVNPIHNPSSTVANGTEVTQE